MIDKTQEMNMRLTVLVKGLEGHNTPADLGFQGLQEAINWVLEPARAQIIPATFVQQ